MERYYTEKNNKGFSLVELVVTISIMVVLIGVLSVTILTYVNKAKTSKDIQAADELARAVKRCAFMYEAADDEGLTLLNISWNGATADDGAVEGSFLESVLKEMAGALPVSSYDENCQWFLNAYYQDERKEENLVIEIYLAPEDRAGQVNVDGTMDGQYKVYPEVGSYWD